MQMLTLLNLDVNSSIPEKILACNPVLEAFGNSKTVRNENSSRFGKYVKIFFGKNYNITGAAIESYLLEKSRVSQVPINERNFHVFYALTKTGYMGAEKAENYEYLNRSGCYEAKDIDDEVSFHNIQNSLIKIGFSKEEEEKIWRLLLVILQLGNLKFE
jgi:myosin heavy subunit